MTSRAELGRSILVVEEGPWPFLWGILGARVSRSAAYVRASTPSELVHTWSRCQPWPWMVVGTIPRVDGLAELVLDHPVPVHWVGTPPLALPPATVHDTWEGLVSELERLDGLALGGVRLLRNRGLLGPDDRVVLEVPELEGLLAAGPGGLPMTARLEKARDQIESNGLPLDLEVMDGRLRLVGR